MKKPRSSERFSENMSNLIFGGNETDAKSFVGHPFSNEVKVYFDLLSAGMNDWVSG
jgi:hypothetical protein